MSTIPYVLLCVCVCVCVSGKSVISHVVWGVVYCKTTNCHIRSYGMTQNTHVRKPWLVFANTTQYVYYTVYCIIIILLYCTLLYATYTAVYCMILYYTVWYTDLTLWCYSFFLFWSVNCKQNNTYNILIYHCLPILYKVEKRNVY